MRARKNIDASRALDNRGTICPAEYNDTTPALPLSARLSEAGRYHHSSGVRVRDVAPESRRFSIEFTLGDRAMDLHFDEPTLMHAWERAERMAVALECEINLYASGYLVAQIAPEIARQVRAYDAANGKRGAL